MGAVVAGQQDGTGREDCTQAIPERWVGQAIFLASALALYVEMVMVRWHASCFRHQAGAA